MGPHAPYGLGTFDRTIYHFMSQIVNENTWAVVFLISFVTQVTIVAQEQFHSTFARYFAAWNAVLWVVVVTSMLISVYPPPAALAGGGLHGLGSHLDLGTALHTS